MVKALLNELQIRKNYLENATVETIYLGGGTPSVLSFAELSNIFSTLKNSFSVIPTAEITIEANPEDITPNTVDQYLSLGINRISLGVQSFDNGHLTFMNRNHTGAQSQQAIETIKSSGLHNFSIDLIYAIPSADHEIWENDIATAMQYDIPHLSCYNLTIEEKTVFGRWLAQNKIAAPEEDFAAEQYELLTDSCHKHGYEQYEISNFCQPGFRSKHNSNYWHRASYLGIGPGAHSFNGNSRQYNISNNALYIKALAAGKIPATTEILDLKTKVNEWIMTSLRTYDGLDTILMYETLGFNLQERAAAKLQRMQENKLLQVKSGVVFLTKKGRLLADWVSQELFID